MVAIFLFLLFTTVLVDLLEPFGGCYTEVLILFWARVVFTAGFFISMGLAIF